MNVLYPAFVMFLMTILVQFRLGLMRFSAVRGGKVDPRYYKTYEGPGEPEALRVHTRHLTNLYEAPTLFYAIVIIAYVTDQSGVLPVVLAWLYVVLRVIHTLVHLGSNRILRRFRIFFASLVVLIALWGIVFAGLLLR